VIGDALGVEPRAVDAYIIGEHGDSEIAVCSATRVAGVALDHFPGGGDLARGDLLDQVRSTAPEIVRRKGATEYTIGVCVKRICEAVLRNEHAAKALTTALVAQLTGEQLGGLATNDAVAFASGALEPGSVEHRNATAHVDDQPLGPKLARDDTRP